jgi:hypothetical protein
MNYWSWSGLKPMVAAENQSTHSQQHKSAESAPLTHDQDCAFFSAPTKEVSPFFNTDHSPDIQAQLNDGATPFFQPPSSPRIQSDDNHAHGFFKGETQQTPILQRTPAFESEDTNIQAQFIQRTPAFESELAPTEGETVQRKPAIDSEDITPSIQAKGLLQQNDGSQTAVASNFHDPSPGNGQDITDLVSANPGESDFSSNIESRQVTQSQSTPPTSTSIQRQAEHKPDVEEETGDEIQTQPKLLSDAVEIPNGAATDDDANSNAQSFIQPKLIIGRVGDRYEREADAMADKVVSRPENLHPSASILQPSSKIVQLEYLNRRSNGSPSTAGGIESRLQKTKGSGRPLDTFIRSRMEPEFGANFSNVRIHTGNEAVDLSQDLGAEAFTHGSDVYFNKGKYNPTSREGEHLLAHELTHTIQQNGLQRKLIQRAPLLVAPEEYVLSDYTRLNRNSGNKQVTIPNISLPTFKERNRRRFPPILGLRPTARQAESNQQRIIWRNSVRGRVQRYLQPMLSEARERGGYVEEDNFYFFKAKNSRSEFHLFGTPEQLLGSSDPSQSEPAAIPFWDKDGFAHDFQVDHAVEDQLVNPNDRESEFLDSNTVSNFELLDSAANSSSGPRIAAEVRRRLNRVVNQFATDFPSQHAARELEFNALRFGGYNVNFESHDFDLTGTSGEPNNYWSYQEIVQGQHLHKLEPLTGRELRLLNREDRPIIFTSGQGGERRFVRESQLPIENWLPRVNLTGLELSDNPSQSDPAGWINVDAFKANDSPGAIVGSYDDMRWRLKSVPGVYGGAIDKEYFKAQFGQTAGQSLRLPGLSPIQLNNVDINQRGIFAEGKVLPTVPIISDADIDIIIDGNDVRLRKLFNIDEIDIPSPFEISSASVEVFYGTRGLGASGNIAFAIQNVGDGQIEASVSTQGGLELEGEFNFDSNLFDPAQVAVTYRNNTFGVAGTIGIPEGKVQGIKSATITASYSEGTFTASGEAELDIRGVERGSLEATYSDDGWSIGGTFNLSDEIPRIRSGSISATVSKVAGQDSYQLTASGTAIPDIPGIDSQLTVEYDNGAITIHANASYERGLLSGSIEVGATNRGLDGDGQPTGEPTDTFILYGGGSLTVQITPWLEGTVGVNFLPNGEMVVSGRIGLPSSIEVFRRIGVPERELFGIGFDIPIFAIPVGPRSIGLVASIRGGLKAHAGIGPGTLEGLELGIEYNPDRPDETHVDGGGRFVIPAEAGLSLFVRATIGLSAVVGGVEGGLELAGGLGLEAEAAADVNVDWTPTTGLELNANLSAHVQPKFVFTIDGLIRAWLAFYEKEWRWRLADYEYGPDFRFGVRLPIHYREGEPFDISFDDLELTYPQIDASSFIGGLIQDIRSSRDESD